MDHHAIPGPTPESRQARARRAFFKGGRAPVPRGYHLAGVALPPHAETQHILMTGAPGTGKTVAFHQLLEQIRANHQRAIIYDKMGVYTQRFYRKNHDVLFNPLDARFPGWHLWAECRQAADFDRLADAFIPSTMAGHDPFWCHAARVLFAVTARKLQGTPSTAQLLRYLLMADLQEIHALFKNTEAEPLVSDQAAKLALSVKAMLAVNCRSMLSLGDTNNPFSIRQWIEEEGNDSCLFITSRDDMHATLTPLIATWLDVATSAMLSLPTEP